MKPTLRAKRVWLPHGLAHDVTIERDLTGRITAIRPAKRGDGPAQDGMIVPGLINAHTHLEIAGPMAQGGQGFLPWLASLKQRDAPSPNTAAQNAAFIHASGVQWVADISNRGDTASALESAGLHGIVYHEHLDTDLDTLPRTLASAQRPARYITRDIVLRTTPHALFSTHEQLLCAMRETGLAHVPASIHIGEAEGEAQFLLHGTGPIAKLLDALGRRWRPFHPPGVDAIAYLDRLGLLGPQMMLVHGVALNPSALRRAARAGVTLCACPRSNLHILRTLPDIETWLRAGGRLVFGTDSLASSPDLDVIAEIPPMARANPNLNPDIWLHALTYGAANALRLRHVGRIQHGLPCRLLHLEAHVPKDLTQKPPTRRWLA